MRIMIIEDDRYTSKLIADFLKEYKNECLCFESGEKALPEISLYSPDIIILDINLPGKSGIEICNIIRSNPSVYSNPVIMMLTGETDTEMVIKGLKTGADDYIKKPFNIEELILRVQSWAKRVNNLENIIKYKDLVLDIDNKNVFENNLPVTLSQKEFSVLEYMIKNKGLTVSREKLMEDIWDTYYYQGCKTVDMTIKRLKDKIMSLNNCIESIPGIGYKLNK